MKRLGQIVIAGLAIAVLIFAYVQRGDESGTLQSSGPAPQDEHEIDSEIAKLPASAQVEPSSDAFIRDYKLVFEINESNLAEKQAAWDAGYAEISEVDAQRVLRWRPVLVNPTIFASKGPGEGIENVTALRVPFFEDEAIEFNRIRYRGDRDSSMYSWTGKRNDGESGEVSIHVVRDQDSAELTMAIHYTDRFKDLHIIPTDNGKFYVSTETNRGFPLKVD